MPTHWRAAGYQEGRQALAGALLQPRRAMQSFHNNAPISAGHALKGVVILLGSMPQDDGLRHSKAMPPHRHASSILTRTHAASR